MTYSSSTPMARLPQATLIVPGGVFGNYLSINTSTTAGAGTANRAYYQPFVMPYTATLLTMSFSNSTGTNNHDMGIYQGTTRLVSRGSTASTSAVVNTWTLSTAQQLVLQEGILYFAAFCTAGTHTICKWSGTSAFNPRFGRVIQANGAVALQATATFAAPAADAVIPILRLTFDR